MNASNDNRSTSATRSSLPSTFHGYLWAASLERHDDALFIRARIYHRRRGRRARRR